MCCRSVEVAKYTHGPVDPYAVHVTTYWSSSGTNDTRASSKPHSDQNSSALGCSSGMVSTCQSVRLSRDRARWIDDSPRRSSTRINNPISPERRSSRRG